MPLSAKKARESQCATTTVISVETHNYGDICLYIYILAINVAQMTPFNNCIDCLEGHILSESRLHVYIKSHMDRRYQLSSRSYIHGCHNQLKF